MPLKPLLALLVCVPLASPQTSSLPSPVTSLPSKEILEYTIDWRLFTGGKARLEFTASSESKPEAQISLHLESAGFVSKLFKVEDDYTSALTDALCVQTSHLLSHEGSRQRETRITFDSEAKKARYVERDSVKNTVLLQQETDIPACVHDVAGGLFFIRTLNLEPGQTAQVPVSDGKKSVMAKVEAQQREDVKTPAGTFKTIRYEVYLFNGVLYKRPAHLNMWLTDDRRKLPVQIRVRLQFTIGTINLLLERHE
jgi:hypothetical protein